MAGGRAAQSEQQDGGAGRGGATGPGRRSESVPVRPSPECRSHRMVLLLEFRGRTGSRPVRLRIGSETSMDDYPLLNLFWTMMWFFLWILWLFLLFRVIGDIFRDRDMGGWGKAGWLILVILLPYLGVLVYLIARGGRMGERDLQAAQQRDQAFKEYVRDAAGGSGPAPAGGGADQLAKLADLKRSGDLSQEEYDRAKARLLA